MIISFLEYCTRIHNLSRDLTPVTTLRNVNSRPNSFFQRRPKITGTIQSEMFLLHAYSVCTFCNFDTFTNIKKLEGCIDDERQFKTAKRLLTLLF